MKALYGGQVQQVAVSDIVVGARLRPVGEAGLDSLRHTAEDFGITTPIHLRLVKSKLVLIDGLHRLTLAREIKQATIASLVWECRADEAHALEAANNLGGAPLTPLQTAVFVGSWKRDYYTRHPERAPGVFKGNQHTEKVVGDIVSLTTMVAGQFAISERQARRLIAAGEALSAEEATSLYQTAGHITTKDLERLGRIGDAPARAAVITALSEGTAKSVAEAQKALQAGVQPPVKDPVEEAFKDLSARWSRAPMAAKKRFLLEHARDIWDAQNRGVALVNWAEARDE
jgi:ParB family transcriptional regulator, chromosome partitioning protein